MNAPVRFCIQSLTSQKMVVDYLYENNDYLIVNKPYDMYINSDDEKETVS